MVYFLQDLEGPPDMPRQIMSLSITYFNAGHNCGFMKGEKFSFSTK